MKKKKLAMILIVLLLGMSVLPAGSVFATTTGQSGINQTTADENKPDENKASTAAQNGNGESAASQKNAQEKNIFNTGTDPLWSFCKSLKRRRKRWWGRSLK